MTNEHLAMLKGIRSQIEALASEIKKAHDAGFQIGFGIDNASGQIKYDIKQMVPVNLDEAVH